MWAAPSASTPIQERCIAGSKKEARSGPVWKTETIQCNLGLSDAIRDPVMSLFLSVTFCSQALVPSLSTHHAGTPQDKGRALGLMVYTRESSLWRLRQEGHEFKADLCYVTRGCY